MRLYLRVQFPYPIFLLSPRLGKVSDRRAYANGLTIEVVNVRFSFRPLGYARGDRSLFVISTEVERSQTLAFVRQSRIFLNATIH